MLERRTLQNSVEVRLVIHGGSAVEKDGDGVEHPTAIFQVCHLMWTSGEIKSDVQLDEDGTVSGDEGELRSQHARVDHRIDA